jgi:hypothetical protein
MCVAAQGRAAVLAPPLLRIIPVGVQPADPLWSAVLGVSDGDEQPRYGNLRLLAGLDVPATSDRTSSDRAADLGDLVLKSQAILGLRAFLHDLRLTRNVSPVNHRDLARELRQETLRPCESPPPTTAIPSRKRSSQVAQVGRRAQPKALDGRRSLADAPLR